MKKPKLSQSLKEELLEEIKKERYRRIVANITMICLVIVAGIILKIFVLDDSIKIADNSVRLPQDKIENQPEIKPEVKGEETQSNSTESSLPTSTIATTTKPKPDFVEYTIEEGDTLGGIANANGLSSEALMSYNGIIDPVSIKPGQIIKVPVN